MTEPTGGGSAHGDLVFIGDVHLDLGDPQLGDFLSFLESLGHSASRIVLLGDLFNVWIGGRELEQPHQAAVAAKLADLRRRGLVVRYVEGNRDFRIAHAYVGSALDEATIAGVEESFGGHRVWAIHGDLANAEDRRYRAWRRLSRSSLFWGLFRMLPGRGKQRLVASLERRMRSSNLRFKQEFPERQVRDYGARFLARGFDTVVLGHFHVERELDLSSAGRTGRVLVLPEWRESRRYLRITPEGVVGFVDSR